MRAALVAAISSAVWLACGHAASAPTLEGGHGAFAIGPAREGATRAQQHLDVGVALGWMDVVGSRDGMWSRQSGWLVGGSGLVGLAGSAPTGVAPEIGFGTDTTLAGIAVLAGPLLRFDDRTRAGATLRVAADLLFVQIGARFVWTDDAPTAHLTLGLGRY